MGVYNDIPLRLFEKQLSLLGCTAVYLVTRIIPNTSMQCLDCLLATLFDLFLGLEELLRSGFLTTDADFG